MAQVWWPAWPATWSRQQRSSATMAVAAVAMLLLLWLMAIPLAWAPEPIGNNAQFFAEGTRMTALLTAVAAVCGVLIGVLAALGKTSTWWLLRGVAAAYIWVIRGTPLLVQVLFVYFALPVLIPALKLSDFASACLALSRSASMRSSDS